MDPAVALVEAYLHLNGYFTVTEYPLLEAVRGHAPRTRTDLDVLALRFPHAGVTRDTHARRTVAGPIALQPDPELGAPVDRPDMIVGEVKEGAAHFNPAARDPLVLGAALTRFGCCGPEMADELAGELLRHGHADSPAGHRVRLVAFGSTSREGAIHVVTTAHMLDFLREHLRRHWSALRHVHLTHPTLAMLALLEKAEHGR